MPRILLALVVFVVAALAWMRLVGVIAMWWMLRHQPRLERGTDTYFIAGSWVFRLAMILPLMLFAIWYWSRFVRRVA